MQKKGKAFVFFTGVLSLILLGLFMGGEMASLYGPQPIHILEFIGSLGNGIFYFFFKLTGWGSGQLASPTYHYGTAYIEVAGFLNFLIAMKAYALAKGDLHV